VDGDGVNVIRIVDSAGVQWTYAAKEDVPPEHLDLVSSAPLSMRMFEPPPERLSSERPIQQRPTSSSTTPAMWIIGGLVVAVAGLVAAILILVW
jgi:hypothetical protein